MNGPAWAILGIVTVIGIAFGSGWIRRARRDRSVTGAAQMLLRGAAAAGLIAGGVLVPVVARPGSQAGWSAILQLLSMPALFFAITDERSVRRSKLGRM